uniref:Uncharacterized protein n=1 Tax=Pseudo-nitzschia australis TaxID=44445 RepID=A0A7S4APD3_9STRA
MGSSHSADLEEETAVIPVGGNDGRCNERMISEIDSDADLDPVSVPSVDVRNYGHEEEDQQHEQQNEDEQGHECPTTNAATNDEITPPAVAVAAHLVPNQEESLQRPPAMVSIWEEAPQNRARERECEARQLQLQPSHQEPHNDEAWGPPPIFASAITNGARINYFSNSEAEEHDSNNNHNHNSNGNNHDNNHDNDVEADVELNAFFRELGLVEGGGVLSAAAASDQSSTKKNDAATAMTTTTEVENDHDCDFFVPQHSQNFEWTRRSLESLVSGFASVAPILGTPGGSARVQNQGIVRGGPNVALNLLARETNAKRIAPNTILPASERLKSMGGSTLYNALDRPSDGMCSEVAELEEAINDGDWIKTQTVISRISPRLIGDPNAFFHPRGWTSNNNNGAMNDPNLPTTAPRFYAGGGRIGLERDAFVLAGGIDVLVRVFRDPCFVGSEMAQSYDARDLSKELVATNRLGHCWNLTLACLRELVYSMPSLLETERVFDGDRDDFLPFLFTLLTHDPFFDGAAALIEEILSLQSHSPQQEEEHQAKAPSLNGETGNNNNCDDNDTRTRKQNNGDSDDDIAVGNENLPRVRVSPPTTFFLGNISDLYSLWGGFNARHLAQFCRILALLIFEPEDRQLLESPDVLKSIELLQLRRNRAARAARDSTVDMNQSILLGDERLVERLLDLLTVLNFGPALRCSSSFHVMAQFPYIADTLMMLGLHEFDDWKDVNHYDKIARTLQYSPEDGEIGTQKQLHELGSVAEMLENLSSSFLNNESETVNQLGHIIAVISAAQQAGVVVGRTRQAAGNRSNGRNHPSRRPNNRETIIDEDSPSSYNGLESLGVLQHHAQSVNSPSSLNGNDPVPHSASRSRITTPEDAANVMQFNAVLLGPFQVEVLFVLCTLLGGRRKIDAQELLKINGITKILDDMFQRLPWDSLSPTREPVSHRDFDNHRQGSSVNHNQNEEQFGIHGPGCECTPESALCVQYLRLLHNFCDRDCDNYHGRRLLLSTVERNFIFQDRNFTSSEYDISKLSPGLLSKIIAAFVGESDESPYRFWLASCVESYLRGSSSVEQVFVAKTGLMKHLIDDVTSQRLHCAGSLQTSFDLLGELCKGNVEVLSFLVNHLDNEAKFRRLMNVAASNLVDSNVFIRSLILSLERLSSERHLHDIRIHDRFESGVNEWKRFNNNHSQGFLTHSWLDTYIVHVNNKNAGRDCNYHDDISTEYEREKDHTQASDWFSTMGYNKAYQVEYSRQSDDFLNESCGRFGWAFKPVDDTIGSVVHGPNSIDRMSWFLSANRTRLLRDLLEVVNLNNINHENICCLNTAIVITIFAYRHGELHALLQDLKQLNDEDSAFFQQTTSMSGVIDDEIVNQHDIMQNFREVLWFWIEYYTHRGRDRLSLEFSSRLRFHEWMEVVTLLAADDGAPTSLVRRPLRLPQSPYRRPA